MNAFADDRSASDCVQCRAGGRFAGSLVPRRFPAALMVGVLSLSMIAPSAAFATEGDRDAEGGAVAEDVVGGDVDLGAAGDLGDDAGAAPVTDDTAAPAAPVPADPASSGAAPAPVSSPDAPDAAATPVPDAPEVPATTPAVVPEEASQAAAPAEVLHAAAPKAGTPQAAGPHRRVKAVRRAARAKRRATRVRVVARPAPSTAPRKLSGRVRVTVPASPRVIRISGAPSRPARPGARSHVVAPGESLWSIATDFLEAGASSGEISREVERLWERNRDRIGTGDRNLLLAGTALQLA
jgi:hypothetical protein